MTSTTPVWSYRWTSRGGYKYVVELLHVEPTNKQDLPEHYVIQTIKDTQMRTYLEKILVGKSDLYKLAMAILRESGLDVEANIEHQETLLKMAEGEIPKSRLYREHVTVGEDPMFAEYMKGNLSALYRVLGVPNPHTVKSREGLTP